MTIDDLTTCQRVCLETLLLPLIFSGRTRIYRAEGGGGVMRGRSSGKTGPPVPGLTRVGGGAINNHLDEKLSPDLAGST
jgi:hypothetical protein